MAQAPIPRNFLSLSAFLRERFPQESPENISRRQIIEAMGDEECDYVLKSKRESCPHGYQFRESSIRRFPCCYRNVEEKGDAIGFDPVISHPRQGVTRKIDRLLAENDVPSLKRARIEKDERSQARLMDEFLSRFGRMDFKENKSSLSSSLRNQIPPRPLLKRKSINRTDEDVDFTPQRVKLDYYR